MTQIQQSPPPKSVIPLTDFFLKINPIHAFTITGNFPKFHVYPSTNVGVILATTYYDTNLIKSPSQESDPLDGFFLKIDPIHTFTITDNLPKFLVYPSTNLGAILATTYYDTRTDGLKDGRVKSIIPTQLRCVEYNNRTHTQCEQMKRVDLLIMCPNFWEVKSWASQKYLKIWYQVILRWHSHRFSRIFFILYNA
jgi:hypothetical protein